MHARGILYGVDNQSIAQSFVLLYSAKLEMVLIARRIWESIVAIVIQVTWNSWNLGLARKDADIEVKGHICAYTQKAPTTST